MSDSGAGADGDPAAQARIEATAAAEHAGALDWWRALAAGAADVDVRAIELRQFALREALAVALGAVPPRPIGDAELRVALEIAETCHRHQLDKVGEPYLGHPRRVAARVQDDPAAHAVALLHDVIEDGPGHSRIENPVDFVASMATIAERVGPQTAVAVHVLTRVPDGDDAGYYARVRANPLARRVKLADIDDNTDPQRVAALDPESRAWFAQKYAKARALLA